MSATEIRGAATLGSFQHVTPSFRLFSGEDSFAQLGRELGRLGSNRAVVFCGASLAREGTLVDLVRSAMGERYAGVFTGVKAHSPLTAVGAAACELARMEADGVVALGGGSAIVTARAASILLAEKKDARSLATHRDDKGALRSPKLLAPKLPQIVIPTTPTTAAVKAGSAVFDEATSERLALFDPKTRAQSVFIHPAAIGSAPPSLLVSASLNTFCMSIEALMSRSGDPLADALLIHALRLLWARLPGVTAANGDPAARGDLTMAAILCGQGTDYTGAGVTTVLGHAVGARFGTENGIVNAVLLPHVLRFNAEAGRTGLTKVAAAVGVSSSADAVVDAVRSLFRDLSVPSTLRSVGVTRQALPGIAAAGIGDWFLGGNPRPVKDASELLHILEEAW